MLSAAACAAIVRTTIATPWIAARRAPAWPPGWRRSGGWSSPARRCAREREIGERAEAALAAALATETGAAAGDLAPLLAAAQIAGVMRAIQREIRRRLLAGDAVEVIAPAIRRAAEDGFAALDRALGEYAKR